MESTGYSVTGRFFSTILSFEFVFTLFWFGTIYENASMVSWLPLNLKLGLAILSLLVGVFAINRELAIQHNTIVVLTLFTLFVSWATLSLSWSPTNGHGQAKILRLVIAGGWLLIAPATIIAQERKRVHRFIRAILLVTLPFAAGLLLAYLTTGNALIFNVANYITASRPLGFAALSVFYFASKASNRYWRYLLFGVVLTLIGILLLTGARGPFIATIGSLGLFILWDFQTKYRNGKKIVANVFKVLIVFTAILTALATLIVRLGGRTTVYRFSKIASDTSIQYRLDFYRFSLEMLLQQPIIGHGFGSFAHLYTQPPNPVYPHNIFLEGGAELGLIGLGIFVLFLFRAIAPVWQRHGMAVSREEALFSMMAIYMIANAMVSGDLYTNNYIYVTLGTIAGLYGNSPSDSRPAG